ncbi:MULTISPECIES: helix-turn-helix and ligand-binding sensor domain-containing protein [Antarcticibacterium]|nr:MULTISPECIES: triple tyrosine motif-containing protein [Antarcticibacterium]
MARDNEDILYFGNNDGVIVYDGERWQKVVLPNNSSVRSLTYSSNGKIYAGGFNELGLIEKDSIGKYYYKSLLKELQLENENLENLWQVHEFKDYIVYRSFKELIVISGNSATHIPSNNAFIFSAVVGTKFYVQDAETGILEFDPISLQLNLLYEPKEYLNNSMVGILPTKNNDLLLVSKEGNVFTGTTSTKEIRLWKTIFEKNINDEIISAIPHEDNYLLGTLGSRILMVTNNGEVIKDSPAFENVHNSSILNLYKSGRNVWALLNNGLDYIEFDSPVSILFEEASIYDILLDNNFIYLATNKGVFYSAYKGIESQYDLKFEKIPNLEGQAWAVQKVEESVIISHDKGLFYLKDNLPHKIGDSDGFWKIIEIDSKPNTYLAANYNGLFLLEKNKQNWNLKRKLSGFNESSRDILKADEENTFWVCHGYKGVYKLKIDSDYNRIYAMDHYTDQNGLTSPFNVNVTRWNDDIIFTTNTGIYEFNKSNNRFEPYNDLNQILDTTANTRKLIQNESTTWVVQDDEVGYFNLKEPDAQVNKSLFLNLKGSLNRGMESILPLQGGNVLIGATTGLYLYNTSRDTTNETLSTKITRISFIKGEAEEQIPLIAQQKISLPNTTEILRFEFSAPGMSPSSPVQYQYILEGIDQKWSSWENQNYKEYTHLRPGNYNFKVRSRDLIGNSGNEATFEFVIPPVWYQTTAAIIGYILLFLALAVLLFYLIKRKIEIEREKARLAAQKSKKLLELEIEQLRLKRDKENIRKDKLLLEEDNIRKSKELANYTMMLVKKKDIFVETFSNLKELKNSINTQAARKKIQDILIKLQQHRIGEEFMDIFDVNFEKVHKNFFKELKNINPDLTKRELRLCAFVKMNLTNKEIAPLLNISIRGVETARYRVRKKLDVQENNFLTYLENISTTESVNS